MFSCDKITIRTIPDGFMTTPELKTKLPAVGTTVFTKMSALAAEHGAVNLGQGFPDFACDPALVDMVGDAMRAGHNQYPMMTGAPPLRDAIASKIEALYGKQGGFKYQAQHWVNEQCQSDVVAVRCAEYKRRAEIHNLAALAAAY